MLIPLQDHLYRLDTPFLSVALSLYVITGEHTTLIDSGIATTPEEFIFPALDAANLTPDLLICTHGHVDHFGGNSALRLRYPAMKIAIQEDDALWAEDHERHLHEMYMCMPNSWQYDDGGKSFLELCGENSAVDLYLRDGQQLDVGSFHFRVIQTCGHSPGHITLHDAARKVAICGDVALGWGASVIDILSTPPTTTIPTSTRRASRRYWRSMRRFTALDISARLIRLEWRHSANNRSTLCARWRNGASTRSICLSRAHSA